MQCERGGGVGCRCSQTAALRSVQQPVLRSRKPFNTGHWIRMQNLMGRVAKTDFRSASRESQLRDEEKGSRAGFTRKGLMWAFDWLSVPVVDLSVLPYPTISSTIAPVYLSVALLAMCP